MPKPLRAHGAPTVSRLAEPAHCAPQHAAQRGGRRAWLAHPYSSLPLPPDPRRGFTCESEASRATPSTCHVAHSTRAWSFKRANVRMRADARGQCVRVCNSRVRSPPPRHVSEQAAKAARRTGACSFSLTRRTTHLVQVLGDVDLLTGLVPLVHRVELLGANQAFTTMSGAAPR